MLVPALGGAFLAAFLLSGYLTPLAARRAVRRGLIDEPGREAHKRQANTVPYGGGWAIYLTFVGLVLGAWLAGAAGARLWNGADAFAGWPAAWATAATRLKPYLDGLTLERSLWNGASLLAGATGMFALGSVDDRRALSARTKLLWQMLFAAFPILAGVRFAPPFVPDWAAVAVTWLWIVAITNAFNLLDNMDGLSAGVAGLAAALFVVLALGAGQWFVAGTLAVLAGAAFGFLRHNFAPARVYMGDAGALFLGYALATLTVATRAGAQDGGPYALAAPVLALAVPIYDSATVVLVRARRGRPWWKGDRNHLSHRLTRLGMSVREAVLTIYLLGLIMGGLAILLPMVDGAGAALVLLLGLGVLALLALLEHAGGTRE